MNMTIMKFQKILRWIPFVNFFAIFLWIATICKYKVPVRKYIGKIWIMLLVFAVLTAPRIIVDLTTENRMLYNIVTQMTSLFQLYFISFFAVRQQEMIMNEYVPKSGDA